MQIFSKRRWQLSVTLGVAEYLETSPLRRVKPQRSAPALRVIGPVGGSQQGLLKPDRTNALPSI